jgi:hypothetical protein
VSGVPVVSVVICSAPASTARPLGSRGYRFR